MYQLDTNISKVLVFTAYCFNDRVAGAFTGEPSVNENFEPLHGSVAVSEGLSSVIAHLFWGW
jgi:hypothetical protein